eukprot:6148991-Prymnesium_polylepis.1
MRDSGAGCATVPDPVQTESPRMDHDLHEMQQLTPSHPANGAESDSDTEHDPRRRQKRTGTRRRLHEQLATDSPTNDQGTSYPVRGLCVAAGCASLAMGCVLLFSVLSRVLSNMDWQHTDAALQAVQDQMHASVQA